MGRLALAVMALSLAGCEGFFGDAEHSAAAATAPAPAPVKPAQAEVYTKLWVQLDRAGRATIVHAVEGQGALRAQAHLSGDYVIEVGAGAETLAADSYENPFEERSFGEDGHEELTQESDTATVVIGIPNAGLGRQDYELRVHRLVRATATKELSAAGLTKLHGEGALTYFAKVDNAAVKAAVSKGVRLAARTAPLDDDAPAAK